MPITWKNVAGRSNADTAILMKGARESISDGFDTLGGVVDDYEGVQKANYTKRVERNTDDVQDYFAGFNSVEELEAAKASGATAEALGQYGNAVDRDAVRDLGRDTRGDLVADETAEVTRDNAKYTQQENLYDRAAKNPTERFKALVNNNEFKKAETFLSDNSGLFTDSGDLGIFQSQLTTAKEASKDRGEMLRQRERQRILDIETDRVTAQNQSITKSVNASVLSRSENDMAQGAGIVALGKEMGFQEIGGNLVLEGQSSEKLEAFQTAITDAGLVNDVSDTTFIKDTMEQITRANPLATSGELRAARTEVIQRLADEREVSVNDMEKILKKSTALDRQYKIDTNEFQNEKGFNPSAEVDAMLSGALTIEGPDGDETEIQEVWSRMFSGQEQKVKITSALTTALTKGVEVDGEHYPITPSMAKIVLKQINSDYWEDDEDINELLKNHVRTEGYKKTHNDFTEWEEKSIKLNNESKSLYARRPGGRDSRVGRILTAGQNSSKREAAEKKEAEKKEAADRIRRAALGKKQSKADAAAERKRVRAAGGNTLINRNFSAFPSANKTRERELQKRLREETNR